MPAGAPLLVAGALASVALLMLGVGLASAAALVLPDGRAWEMVSPSEKNNSLITGIDGVPGTTSGGVPQAAANGESIVYASNGAFAEPPTEPSSAPLAAQYLATRGPSGWSTVGITPAIASESYGAAGVGGPYRAFSAELSSGLLLNGTAIPIENQPLPNTHAPEGYQNYYVQELATGTGGFHFQAVLTDTPSEPPSTFRLELQGASPDLSHIVFATEAALTPGARADEYRNLYEWSAGEGLQLVNVNLPAYAILGENESGEPAGLHAISDDGSVVFFTDERDLYAHVTGADPAVVQVDVPRESGPGLESGGGEFQTASSDGSRVFFIDKRRLTNDSTPEAEDLYEYDLKTEQLSDLTTEDPDGAGVQRVLGASEDGSYVYFVATGELVKGVTPGCCNLYVWHRGTSADTTKFIAALSPNDNSLPIAEDWSARISFRTSRVAPDGLNLVFMSEAHLTPYDNMDSETGQREEEVYDYNAVTGALSCASCDPSGAPPTGSSSIPGGTMFALGKAIYQSRVLSDVEGRARVFFDSSDALVPQDTNGTQDVYEWEEDGRGSCRGAGGCVALISSGASNGESSFLDASADGSDVFFLTESELVPQDTDQLLDVYDAREGGGFPAPTAASPACEGEACAAPVVQTPVLGAPLSESYVGLGNPPPIGSKPAVRVRHTRSKPKRRGRKPRPRHNARKARRGTRGRR